MNTFKTTISSLFVVISVLLLTSNVIAASEIASSANYEEECSNYAKEEIVPTEMLSNYIKECIEYMLKPEQETESTNERLKEDLK